MQSNSRPITVGDVLRDWRARRRLSQMDLAGEAGVSTRHLSFVESGRSVPSREVLLRLSEPLQLPPRERNRLFTAAGYAPIHSSLPLDADEMSDIRAAVDAILSAHAPYPAVALDRHWNLVASNEALQPLLDGVSPQLLKPPVNVLRLTLSREGLAPRIENLPEWRSHLLTRLSLEAERTGDAELVQLHGEFGDGLNKQFRLPTYSTIAVPLILRDANSSDLLRLLSTTTVFGTANDVTLSELTLETFYPADDITRKYLVDKFDRT